MNENIRQRKVSLEISMCRYDPSGMATDTPASTHRQASLADYKESARLDAVERKALVTKVEVRTFSVPPS